MKTAPKYPHREASADQSSDIEYKIDVVLEQSLKVCRDTSWLRSHTV